MKPSAQTELCLKLFPELGILYSAQHLEKEPELMLRLTAVHVVASGLHSGKEYEAFRRVLAARHLPHVQAAAAARAEAEKAAAEQSVRDRIRQKRHRQRTGKPFEALTPEEEAVERLDARAAAEG